MFSVIVEPGFFRLAVLPGLPVAGALAGRLLHSPVILVTDRRLVFARRRMPALVIDLPSLKDLRVRESALERALGFGAVDLLVQPAEDLGEGIYLSYVLAPLPDAQGLAAALAGSPDRAGGGSA